MYDYRVLFPYLGEREVRQQQDLARENLARERRAAEGCLRPERRTRRERA
jgi:hypothetical protein